MIQSRGAVHAKARVSSPSGPCSDVRVQMSVAVSEMKMEGKGGPRDAVGDSSAPALQSIFAHVVTR